jgi:uncharacterized protein (TIGR03435 family)
LGELERREQSRKQKAAGDDSQKGNSNDRGRGWEMVCVPLFDKNAKDGAPGHLRWFNEFQLSRCFIIYGAKLTHDVMTSRKLLLPLLLLLLGTELAHAQTSAPTFEVTTIKPTGPSSDGHTHINYPPGDRFSASNITLLALMQWAYGMPERQILDGPPWLGSTRFDIQATADTDQIKGLTGEQDRDLKRRMVQALLVDRFHLKLHQETRALPAYDLILAKGGSKLQPTKSSGKNYGIGRTHFNGEGLTMTSIAEELSQITGRVVVDKTNLADRYDFKLEWSGDDAPATDNSAPSLFTAIQEQLGLKLEPVKEPVPVLVIDHIETPTPN